jgi:hypothetical protein
MTAQDPLFLDVKSAYETSKGLLAHNHCATDIYEGNLLPYVIEALREQLKGQAFEDASHRVAPINLLTKIIDKLSGIYTPAPVRRMVSEVETDKALFDWYTENMDVDSVMAQAAVNIAMTKMALIQPFPHEGKPCLRAVMTDRFFVMSNDRINPLKPTHVVTVRKVKEAEREKTLFYVYSKDQFVVFDSDGDKRIDIMSSFGNAEGVNYYEAVPFVYETSSRNRLMPTPDTDMLAMTKLIPLLLSDLNYAVMYMSFGILYGIDVNDGALQRAPSAFWSLKSDDPEKKPTIGTVKPEVDIDQVMSLVQSELSLWLNSKGIRPGTVGSLDKDSFASGVSKIVDEMDTFEGRKKLVELMTRLETKVWNLIMHKMHPIWVAAGELEETTLFSPDAKIEVVFPEQQPLVARGQLVTDQKAELDAGFTTLKRCIAALNPRMSDDDIDALIAEIRAEKAANKPEQIPQPNQAGFGKPGFGKQQDDQQNQNDQGDNQDGKQSA